jgi:UDP-N-acetylmuramate--alanine ligase
MVDVSLGRDHAHFGLVREGTPLARVELAVPGIHNARNAAAALTTAGELGVPPGVAARALAHYAGVARRFEWRGQRAGVAFVDDYGHLPNEVRAALAAARAGGWQRVVAVFQPHRYSRTSRLWESFADAFVDADVVVLTDVYPAGEAPIPGVTGRLIADAVKAAHPEAAVTYVPERRDLAERVGALLRPGDLCCSLGAGDVTTLAGELLVLRAEDAG